ncbi:MAG: hypothetical protein ACERKV_10925 [Clostridiaceae bacterium]
MFKSNMIKHHYMNKLSKKEKMALGMIISLTFMRGICVGFYLNEK